MARHGRIAGPGSQEPNGSGAPGQVGGVGDTAQQPWNAGDIPSFAPASAPGARPAAANGGDDPWEQWRVDEPDEPEPEPRRVRRERLERERHAGAAANGARQGRPSVSSQVIGILGEVLLTFAVICVLYIVWQLWWTGVESERVQAETRQQVSWSAPASHDGSVTIAQPQQGDPPVQPTDPAYGSLIAQMYIPRFGNGWERNVVQGTDLAQLARHGLGHYEDSQLPGQVGNFAGGGNSF